VYFSELLARVNALSRRPAASVETTHLNVADLELDLLKRTARRGDVNIELQPREFTLLEVLMRNADRVVSRTMLLEQVWDFHFDPKTSVVETHISRLRTKIDKPNLWQSFLRGLYARSSLMRSTPFRIGMGFWLLFCVTIGFAGYSFYHSLQQQSLQRIDQGLDARHSVTLGRFLA